MGISLEPVQARVRQVQGEVAQKASYAPDQPTPVKHEGAFVGVLFIPMTFELFGRRVDREARVGWGYTPAWDHYDRRRRGMVSGALEALSLHFEVAAQPDQPTYRLCRDGHFRVRPQQVNWVPLDLLADGILPAALNDEIERRIDQDAREQDLEYRQRAEEMWRKKHGGPWRPSWRIVGPDGEIGEEQ
jgi:hypothetical protein